MNCCPNCFSDKFLKEHIEAISNKNGTCSYCKTNNVTLINPNELYERFEPLFDLYDEDSNGNELIQLLQDDWNVFACVIKNTFKKKLLIAISGNNEIVKKKYKSIHLKEQKNIEQWENFRDELKFNNRFFPNNALKKEQLEPFGKHIGILLKKGKQKFYRARINIEDEGYSLLEMGKPPNKAVLNGRANPHGISYLYVASTIDTAISEIRGHKEEILTIAEFEMIEDLELADLRNPKNNISPFELNEENELELIYKNMSFLVLLGEELSKPIIPREANLEYLPSQYLSELIKQIGFHGIIYKSSTTDGNNYVLFDDRKVKPIKIQTHKITNVIVESKKIS